MCDSDYNENDNVRGELVLPLRRELWSNTQYRDASSVSSSPVNVSELALVNVEH
jgi:hypothetical protein